MECKRQKRVLPSTSMRIHVRVSLVSASRHDACGWTCLSSSTWVVPFILFARPASSFMSWSLFSSDDSALAHDIETVGRDWPLRWFPGFARKDCAGLFLTQAAH